MTTFLDPYDSNATDIVDPLCAGAGDAPLLRTDAPTCSDCPNASKYYCQDCNLNLCVACGELLHANTSTVHLLCYWNGGDEARTSSHHSLPMSMLDAAAEESSAPPTPRSEHSYTMDDGVPAAPALPAAPSEHTEPSQTRRGIVRASSSSSSMNRSRRSASRVRRKIVQASSTTAVVEAATPPSPPPPQIDETKLQLLIEKAVEERMAKLAIEQQQQQQQQQKEEEQKAAAVESAQLSSVVQQQLQEKWDFLRNLIDTKIQHLESTLTTVDDEQTAAATATTNNANDGDTLRTVVKRTRKKSRRGGKQRVIAAKTHVVQLPTSAAEPPSPPSPPKRHHGRMPPRYLQPRMSPAQRALSVKAKEQQYLQGLYEQIRSESRASNRKAPEKPTFVARKRRKRRVHRIQATKPRVVPAAVTKQQDDDLQQRELEKQKQAATAGASGESTARSPRKVPDVVIRTQRPRVVIKKAKPKSTKPSVMKTAIVARQATKASTTTAATASQIYASGKKKKRPVAKRRKPKQHEEYPTKAAFESFLQTRLAEVSKQQQQQQTAESVAGATTSSSPPPPPVAIVSNKTDAC